MTPSSRIPRRAIVKSMMTGPLLMPAILQSLLADGARAGDPLAPRGGHFPAKAKRVIFLFLTGGYSHIDTFDPKSTANGRDGESRNDKLMGSIWPHPPDPKTGIEITDLFPHLRQRLEDICLIRSMKSAHFDHAEATLGMHTCSAQFSRPCLGSWVSYGLGTDSRDLPSFVVLAPILPYAGTQVYSNDFLPAFHQGTRIIPGSNPIPDLAPRGSAGGLQELELSITQRLNMLHLDSRTADSNLAARIQSFETAYQMQTAAPEAMDVERESAATQRLYGLDEEETKEFAWQCLVARRLAERGVRFIELVHKGASNRDNWDSHGNMNDHVRLAREIDRPVAGLLADLKARGMLDETVVVCTTEFGRTPRRESKFGRNHHGTCFSIWVAGGGFKRGHVHGESDDRGFSIASGGIDVFDLHATILHQLGINHERLTYRYAGRDFRLTDVHGQVRDELLA